jgi:putative ATP-dependent endonuclease of the OLD family
MRLTEITIKNFRGLAEIQLQIRDFTTLIGQNNSGKSTILRAIQLLCNGLTPELEEFRNKVQDGEIEIIGVFEDIKDWERNMPGVAGLICENKIQLRLIATIDDFSKGKIEREYTAYKKQETITGWSDAWSELNESIKEIAATVSVTTGTHFKTQANKERIKQAIRDHRPDLIVQGDFVWTNEGISIAGALQQGIPKVVLIPAVRDAVEETKAGKTAKTAFGELINQLIVPTVKGLTEYTTIVTALEALGVQIQNPEALQGIKAINDKITARLKGLIDVKSKLTLTSPDIDGALISSVGIRIVDGENDTPIYLQGHGLQRTLIFALLEIIAERNAASEGHDGLKNTVILFEEPELYMHPHMLRKIKTLLLEISSNEHWQVICSTHSPFLIEVVRDPCSLVILRKNTTTKVVTKSQLTSSPFPDDAEGQIEKAALRAALDFHPSVCEVFFAEAAVLVEGDTEMALLKHCEALTAAVGVDNQKVHDTTIVSCGGKWTIPAVARLLNAFNISYKIVHDRDQKGLTVEQLEGLPAIHPFKANGKIAALVASENILVNDDTIEHLWGGNGSSAKPYNAVVTIQNIIANNELDNYPRLKEFVTFCYS